MATRAWPVIEFSFANDAKGDAVVPNPIPVQIRGSIHSMSEQKVPQRITHLWLHSIGENHGERRRPSQAHKAGEKQSWDRTP